MPLLKYTKVSVELQNFKKKKKKKNFNIYCLVIEYYSSFYIGFP